MPNINRAPLSRDFKMYYAGTHIMRRTADGVHTMLVSEVGHEGDDRVLGNVIFYGKVWNHRGELVGNVETQWRADDFEVILPKCGYYRVQGASSPVYLQYHIGNRTNRRGLDIRTMTLNGGSVGITGKIVAQLLNQSEFPGQYGKDMCVTSNQLLWKGELIGSLRDGVVTLNNGMEPFEELVCKQLGKHLGTVEIRFLPQ